MKLYDKLVDYSKTNIYPMHMPGHKRNIEMMNMVDPYSIDITEIEGFDNLFHETDILKTSMERAGKLYNSDYSHYLIGGSSAGILSGIAACTNKGDKVLVARNCHKSVYNGIYLNELKPIYIYPQINSQYGINCGLDPEKIRKILVKNQDIKLIIITSPTYEGVVSDIGAISKIAHEYNIPLLVDEAHGAHLGFHPYFPNNSIKQGADITIHSLHKTLPSFTQTALLHVNSDLVDDGKIKQYLSIYQSSSPSYILMASIDKCINLLIEDKEELFSMFANRLESFYKKMEGLKYIQVITKKDIRKYNQNKIGNSDLFDFDPSKIIVSTRNTNLTGSHLYDLLLEKYEIQVEMAASDYIIAMTSICDTDSGFERLASALIEIDNNIEERPSNTDFKLEKLYQDLDIVMTSWQAINGKKERILFKNSQGRIAGEYIYLYPPGIPILLPGERITNRHIEELEKYKALGLSIQGLEDYDLNYIKVLI